MNAPDIAADLAKLNAIPDDVFLAACREEWIKKMARDYAVPVRLAEARLAGVGPFLPKGAAE